MDSIKRGVTKGLELMIWLKEVMQGNFWQEGVQR